MSPTHQKKRTENISAKTAMHVSYVAMTAAGYASAKNSAPVKNQQKIKGVQWITHLGLTAGPRSYIVYLR